MTGTCPAALDEEKRGGCVPLLAAAACPVVRDRRRPHRRDPGGGTRGKSAREKPAAAQEVYDRNSTELKAMAVAQYTGTEPRQVAMLAGTEDPAALLGRMALVQHLVALQDARLSGYAKVRDDRQRAQDEAAARAGELDQTVGELEERKKKAERQIERISTGSAATAGSRTVASTPWDRRLAQDVRPRRHHRQPLRPPAHLGLLGGEDRFSRPLLSYLAGRNALSSMGSDRWSSRSQYAGECVPP
ncbi:coiled-coil domain-containing protein [Nonomuraea polychroma]|uniref:coiled-coil domain-containing protein n=1 Tax=Nonomuraea polychroma TaxID=46176 RepID=UPI003D90668F